MQTNVEHTQWEFGMDSVSDHIYITRWVHNVLSDTSLQEEMRVYVVDVSDWWAQPMCV